MAPPINELLVLGLPDAGVKGLFGCTGFIVGILPPAGVSGELGDTGFMVGILVVGDPPLGMDAGL